jgi:hypothetical protein
LVPIAQDQHLPPFETGRPNLSVLFYEIAAVAAQSGGACP